MAGKSTIARGNVLMETMFNISGNTPSVTANTSAIATYTVQGVLPNDFIEINQLSHITGLAIGNVWASAANTLTIQFCNLTGTTIGATAINLLGVITRCEDQTIPNGVY